MSNTIDRVHAHSHTLTVRARWVVTVSNTIDRVHAHTLTVRARWVVTVSNV